MSTIDDKKSNNDELLSNLRGFLTNIFGLFLVVILYVGHGALLIYICRLAQSSLLPTDIYCYPYEETKPSIDPIQTNVFTTYTNNSPPMSVKLGFPYNKYNATNKLLDLFRKYKQEPQSNFLGNYFVSILTSLMHINYVTLDTTLNIFNAYLPESVLLLLSPFLMGGVLLLLFFINHLGFLYYWFSNMGWFFKTNVQEGNTGGPKWEDVGMLQPFRYMGAICLVVLFALLCLVCFPFFSMLSSAIMMWCLCSCYTYKAEMHNQMVTCMALVRDVFRYYKVPVMSVVSLLVVSTAFSKLGPVQGIFSLLVVGLIYFGIISVDIFHPTKLGETMSPMTTFDQARKVCQKVTPQKPKHGVLYNLLFGEQSGGGGGNLLKELRGLAKKMNV
jgi:hypothetical protein